MNMSNPYGNMYPSLKQKGYIPQYASNMEEISRLANDTYMKGLAPGLAEKMFSSEMPVQEERIMPDEPEAALYWNRVKAQEEIIKHTADKTGVISSSAASMDSAYYFMDGFKSGGIPEQSMSHGRMSYDVYSIRKDFPILQRRINGRPLVWLDNAATTQKPMCVINALNNYYCEYNSNVHRGAHTLAKLATSAYESAREKVRKFIGASSVEEIIFVRGTTEAVNLVAGSYGSVNIREGDEILLTMMEHHSNIVPWQMLVQSKGAVLKAIPVNDRGEVILEEYEKLLTPRTRMVAMAHVSNALGTVNPVRIMIEMAHRHGACVLVDGAQSVPHIGVDVRSLDADFYAFSGHKVYGPTGIGVLYGKRALLEEMPPWQRGGGMIKNVSIQETTYNSLPAKFEAGTGNIADAVGLGTAIDYVMEIGMKNIEMHERELTGYAMEALSRIPGLHIIGTAPDKTSVISFVIDGVAPENIAKYLNMDGIAVRAGHHCAQPILRRYGLNGSARASIGIYNTREEVDCMVKAVLKIAQYYNHK